LITIREKKLTTVSLYHVNKTRKAVRSSKRSRRRQKGGTRSWSRYFHEFSDNNPKTARFLKNVVPSALSLYAAYEVDGHLKREKMRKKIDSLLLASNNMIHVDVMDPLNETEVLLFNFSINLENLQDFLQTNPISEMKVGVGLHGKKVSLSKKVESSLKDYISISSDGSLVIKLFVPQNKLQGFKSGLPVQVMTKSSGEKKTSTIRADISEPTGEKEMSTAVVPSIPIYTTEVKEET
jgi:hypothetical protein